MRANEVLAVCEVEGGGGSFRGSNVCGAGGVSGATMEKGGYLDIGVTRGGKTCRGDCRGQVRWIGVVSERAGNCTWHIECGGMTRV